MPSPALAPPPRTAAAPPADAPPPVRRARAPLSRPIRRHPTGQVTRAALLGSLAAHAALLALAFWLLAHPGGQILRELASSSTAASSGGGETVSYVELGGWPTSVPSGGAVSAPTAAPATAADVPAVPRDTASAAVLPPTPREVPRGIFPPPATSRGGVGAPGAPAAGAGTPGAAAGAGQGSGAGNGAGNGAAGSGAGTLRPGYVDPRLVVKPVPPPPPPPRSDIEQYREHLQARIDELNAGAANETERQRRLRNWTWRDGKGREWGIGEGGVPVIAGHRIPIAPPLPPPDRDKENASRERARQTAEIEAQDEAQARDRHIRERIRATRVRQDSIRKARREGEHKDP
jgi:hypothetical protein